MFWVSFFCLHFIIIDSECTYDGNDEVDWRKWERTATKLKTLRPDADSMNFSLLHSVSHENFFWLDQGEVYRGRDETIPVELRVEMSLKVQLCLLEWFNFRRSFGILIIVRTFSPLLVISVNILLLIDFLNYIAQLFTCLLPFSSTHSPMIFSMCVRRCVRLFNWNEKQKCLVESSRVVD